MNMFIFNIFISTMNMFILNDKHVYYKYVNSNNEHVYFNNEHVYSKMYEHVYSTTCLFSTMNMFISNN